MRFFCDRMLGKLAKKLRLLGFDTLYFPQISEEEILKRVKDRILLTRDRELFRRAKKEGLKALYVEPDDWRSQLRFLTAELSLTDEMRPFSRCVECNTELVDARPEDVKDRVPEYVLKTHDEFKMCPKCGKVYWRGTHVDFILMDMRKLVGEWKT